MLPPLSLFLAAGCVSASPGGGVNQPVLDFGSIIVESAEILHEVHVFFEMDRDPRTDEEKNLLSRVGSKQAVEDYAAAYPDERRFENFHRFSYDKGMFRVGEFTYPAERNGFLFILKERPGPFTFSFRDVEVTIERSAPWKPAVLYFKVEEEKELEASAPARRTKKGQVQRRRVTTRLVSEELQVGLHRLTAYPNTRVFGVNGHKFQVPPGGTITINPRGGVKTSG